jgi:GNAT superfamily N-acetyltransferase
VRARAREDVRGLGADPRVEVGRIGDYHALAHWHYRAAAPATHVRVLRLRGADETTIGVMVVSMPTLNNLFRRYAWPGRYDGGSKRESMRRLCAEVRTISRVVIDPRFRGLGLARRLVRAYLDEPLTPATEAAAAMGACCGFFAGAGMTEYRPPPPERDLRLADALSAAGIDPLALLGSDRAGRLLASHPMRGFMERELRRWAGQSRSSKHLILREAAEVAPVAANSLVCRPVGYAYTSSKEDQR